MKAGKIACWILFGITSFFLVALYGMLLVTGCSLLFSSDDAGLQAMLFFVLFYPLFPITGIQLLVNLPIKVLTIKTMILLVISLIGILSYVFFSHTWYLCLVMAAMITTLVLFTMDLILVWRKYNQIKK